MTDTDQADLDERVADLDQRVGALVARVDGLVTRVEGFDAVDRLIALILDPQKAQAHLSELGKLSHAISRARLELGNEASKHSETVRRDRQALDERAKELAARELAVRQGEASVEAKLRVLSQPPSPDSRLRQFPNGMTAEPDEPPAPRHLDPHFGRSEETVLERVAPTASTLTRSVPKPRRSMRRLADAP